MKKMTKVFAMMLVVVMMAGMLVACGKKEPITADAFKSAAEAAGMTVADVHSQSPYDADIFTDALCATHPDGWQVVFLGIDSAEHAHEYFLVMKKFIEDQKTGSGSSQTTDNGSWAFYSQTNGGMFAYTSLVNNTMIYAAPAFADSYKAAMQDFIKSINY